VVDKAEPANGAGTSGNTSLGAFADHAEARSCLGLVFNTIPKLAKVVSVAEMKTSFLVTPGFMV